MYKGRKVIDAIEGIDQLRSDNLLSEMVKEEYYNTEGKSVMLRKKRKFKQVEKANIEIVNSGVYRVGMSTRERMTTPAAAFNQKDFVPEEFLKRRQN